MAAGPAPFRASADRPPLPAGRECGNCHACCVSLEIRDPELRKARDVPCANLLADRGCGIYPARPRTCRGFLCGWRQLAWVAPGLRPDRSAVLVRLHGPPPGAGRDGAEPETRVIFTLLSERGLAAEGLAESMAAAVAAGLPVLLEVPAAAGGSAGVAPVNAVLAGAVRVRDKPAMLAVLRRCWEMGRRQAERLAPD